MEVRVEDRSRSGERVRCTRVYSEVPLGSRRRTISKSLPPLLQQLRAIDGGHGTLTERKARQFYLQAKLAENYEDSFPTPPEAALTIIYYPTYESLDDNLLRGYFFWRKFARRHEIADTAPTLYLTIYSYELLNGIGGEPEDCLRELIFLKDLLAGSILAINLKNWIHDFIIYHHLESALVPDNFEPGRDAYLSCLLKDPMESDANDFLTAASAMSTYSVTKSAFYKKSPGLLAEAVQAAVRDFDAYLRRTNSLPLTEMCFGPGGARPVTLFRSAVFCPHREIKEEIFRISDLKTYRCLDGGWYLETAYSDDAKSELLGEFLAEVDRLMRIKTGICQPTKSRMKDPLVTEKLSQILDTFLARKEEEKRPKLTLDMNSLAGIRRDAELTMNSLIIDEENEPAPAPPEFSQNTPEENEPVAENVSPAPLGLTADEAYVLRALLAQTPWQPYIAEHHLKLTMLVDSINEKFMDDIGDTIIEFSGDTPQLIEDYTDDVQELLNEKKL